MASEMDNSKRQDGTKESLSSASQVIVGCRNSELALVQARDITSQLAKALTPSPAFEIATKSVAGDADKQTPFMLLSKQTGGSDVGKSLWTNGLEVDLVSGKVHFLVHCLKDMPTTLPPDCLLGAIPEREDASDAVVMRSGSEFKSIDQLPSGSVVGSSSSRRRALVKRNWPHLEVAECRGNLDTRLGKLDADGSPFSCILLATAGLSRLGLGHRVTQRLDASVFPYAVGQGALGLEVKTGQADMLRLVQAADHKPSRWRGLAERAMLRSLQGGCSSPIGVWSAFDAPDASDPGGESRDGGTLRLNGMVLDVDGTTAVQAEDSGSVWSDEEAERLGVAVADLLIREGAQSLLSRHSGVDSTGFSNSLPLLQPLSLSPEMALFTILAAAAAALFLTGVEAGGAPRCMAITAEDRSCGAQGYIGDTKSRLGAPTVQPGAGGCADHCSTTAKCTAFMYREGGMCQLYQGDFKALGFTEHESFSFWYEMGCFACSKDGTVFEMDFEGDVGTWQLHKDTRESFSFDLKAKGAADSKTALRVSEGTDSGHGRVEYTIPIQLQGGTSYAFGISLKNSRNDLGTEWTLLASDLLTLHLKRHGVSILESKPRSPEKLTHDWIRFTNKFATGAGEGGPVILSIEIQTTGVALEWYFDDIYIKEVDG
ncbi:hypothetical protein AK830_g10689 [Neonectria ditissima]|uniref:hydroxymethylbilane synthase n=1 Tax=Neonectria ditissima TaxID=78410 RepID=A0A0P7B6P7_9HYPO|nr:hypothetical protein AK830_g10689 [Neonectria ditissima]